MSDSLVTFVIPTVGRDSLTAALRSLRRQTDDRWRAVVVTDGFASGALANLDEIWPMIKDGVVFLNGDHEESAGLTRNLGIEYVFGSQTTPWIAFLDDDDELHPRYVEWLASYDRYGIHDLVVFRADWPDGTVLPDPDEPCLERGHVGISFAARDWLFRDGHRFAREDPIGDGVVGGEGADLLEALLDDGARHVICPQVMYRVRPGERA